jgi:hypothetical protein
MIINNILFYPFSTSIFIRGYFFLNLQSDLVDLGLHLLEHWFEFLLELVVILISFNLQL